MPVVLKQGSVTLTCSPFSISSQKKGKNKVIPIPDADPITIPLGREGPQIKIEARLSSVQFTSANSIVQGGNVTVESGTTLEDLTPYIGNSFYVDDIRTSRKAGQNDEWDLMIQMTRNYSV
jgi:hypothetical protein